MQALTSFVVIFAVTSAGAATPFTPGNTLVQAAGQVLEVNTAGDIVRTLDVPPDGDGGPRDLLVDDLGRLHVYNGTGDPVLSTYDPNTSAWTSQTATGWSTVNNASYGGIATWRDYVFVSDMDTFSDDGADQAAGVVRFDLANNEWVRFATGTEPIDLNVGQDGLLYVLSPGGSPGGRVLDLYDPETSLLIDTIELTSIFGFTEHRAVTADASGTIYLADWDGDVAAFTRAGIIVAQANVCDEALTCNLYDIDITANGQIVIGDRAGGVTLTDSSLTSFDVFDSTASFDGAFVSFVPQYNDDNDLVPNRLDSCIEVDNPQQIDSDADGYGNACDTDLNGDCVTNATDLGLLRAGFFGTDSLLDFNGDGAVNVVDLGVMRTYFFAEPGPSGLTSTCADL